ncbi:hypothetical protein HYX70_03570 [Candidatus Saccharibacteria bacterium]|nr:hypothetical protein [Candidatus Saccharibacteria bacterium]
MAEKGGEELQGVGSEQQGEKLQAELSAERKSAKATEREIKSSKAELEKSGEKAEKKLAREAEKEATEANLAKKSEASEAKKAKQAEKSEKKEPIVAATPKERNRAYKKEMRKVQAQLSPGSRMFSKVVHNRAVEVTSNVAEKTVVRSSVLIGGTVVGIILGGLVYFSANRYGYGLPNWSLVFFLIMGGVLGVVIEFLLKATRSTK